MVPEPEITIEEKVEEQDLKDGLVYSDIVVVEVPECEGDSFLSKIDGGQESAFLLPPWEKVASFR